MMQWALFSSFLLMGFMGSWHCGLMCGPLCCNFKRKQDFILYQVGRLISYLVLGVLLFYGVKYFLNVESRPLKIAATVVYAFVFIFFGLAQLNLIQIKNLNFKYAKFQFAIVNKSKRMVQKFPVLLGLLSGLFPCMWLYSFLFLSTQMNTLRHSLIVIFIFWATALPAFIAVSGFMQNLIRSSPTSHQKISGAVLILAGVFSIVGHWVAV